MNKNKRKKKISSWLDSKIFLLLVFLLAIFLANSALNMYLKSMDAKQYLNTTIDEYSSLEAQYDSAYSDLEYLKSETGIEKEIREKFDLARDGEKAVLIIDEELTPVHTPQKKTFWRKIKDWVSF
jgi:hypothetical protein